ncbi:MAG: fibronectin type III domain-containing protein [Candidatus Cryosericum sp.]
MKKLKVRGVFLTAPALATITLLIAGCPAPESGGNPKPPAAPDSLIATTVSSSSIQTGWADASDNEDNFILEHSKAADFSGKIEFTLPSDSTVKLVEMLDPGTKYYFRVYARNADGSSDYSNVAEATTQAPPVAIPAAPGNLTATMASSYSIQAAWTDASDNEDNFVLAYGLAADFAGSTDVILAANTTSTVVYSLAANTKYYFRVKAVNRAGSSAWSDPANSTTAPKIAGSMVIDNDRTYSRFSIVSINSDVPAAAQMRFSNDSMVTWSDWETYAATKAWTLASGADGSRGVYGEFKDAFGSPLFLFDTISLDTTPPEVYSFSINWNAPYTSTQDVTLCQRVFDNMSGVAWMCFSNGVGWSAWENYADNKSWTLSSGDGTQYVIAMFKDAAGNWSPQVNDAITLDTTPP